MPTSGDAAARQYLFIVTRSRPDILARARECLGHHPHIEVIVDRRHAERRRLSTPHAVERRLADRRRTPSSMDARVHPTLFVPKHLPTYAELQQHVAALQGEVARLRAENAQLRQELDAARQASAGTDSIRRTSDVLAEIARSIEKGGQPAEG